MDPFKRACQLAGVTTAKNIDRLASGELRELTASRGESAYIVEVAGGYLAHVEEGLGTKSLVADAMYQQTGRSYYDNVAQCTVAMIVNDLITAGALPVSVAMHLAVGESDWFDDEVRAGDLIRGWKTACDLARCVWGGGETPTLNGVVVPGTVVLSGSAMGIVEPKERLIEAENICPGDAIMLIGSSGIHANGLTLARKIADKLPHGYLTLLPDGRRYGEALLDPTLIYVGLVEDCLNQGVEIHYLVNITGHGWRKLMRAPQPLHYVVDTLPEPQAVFGFIQKEGPVTTAEMFGNCNMGAGFALYVPPKEVAVVQTIAARLGLTAIDAGRIEAASDKRVILKPLDLEFHGESLGVR